MRKLRRHIFQCEWCKKEVIKVNRNKNPGRFCDKSCSNAWQHSNEIRKDYRKQKTVDEWWKEKYSLEEIELLKQARSLKQSDASSRPLCEKYSKETYEKVISFLRQTWDVKFGEDKANFLKKEFSNARKGTSFIDLMDPERKAIYLANKIPPMLGKRHSEETRHKMSSTVELQYKNGRSLSPRSGRGIAGTYKGVLFRSAYEFAFMKYLENLGFSLDSDVLYEHLRISYQCHENKDHVYVPDFFIPSIMTVIEVKPKKRLTDNRNIKKFEAAQDFCKKHGLQFKIVTEDDLDDIFLKKVTIELDNNVCLFGRKNDR